MSRKHLARCGAAFSLALLAGQAGAQAVYIGTGSGINGAGDLYGNSVAQLHDVNGDGINEILVGAPGSDDNGVDSGTVFVLNGANGVIVYEVHGSTAGDELGWSVANLGDVDNDGIDDFAAGRPGRDFNGNDAGGVAVYSGDGGGILWSQTWSKAGARAGSVVAAAGDVNGDGRGDVLVGAPSYDGPNQFTDKDWGRVVLYSGNNGLPLKTVTGTAQSERLGAATAGLPDLDGDGVPEFAIGAPGREGGGPIFFFQNAGACDVYSGQPKTLLFSISGSTSNEDCGSSVATLGDTDNDGLKEFVVGRPGWSSDRGRVTVHEGSIGKTIKTLDGLQLSSDDRYGTAVCAAGDVNKDGHVDLIVGAPATGTGSGGWSHVISGKDWAQYGDAYNSYADWGFGTTIAAGLDTSDDNWPDAIYGMPTSNNQGTDSGFLWGYRYTHYQPNILFQGPGYASLQMYGTELYSGGVADITVYGLASTPVYLLASLFDTPVNFKGGVIVPQVSSALILPLVTDIKGRATIANVPGGNGFLQVYMQALLPVAGAPQGWWITNAITVELLP